MAGGDAVGQGRAMLTALSLPPLTILHVALVFAVAGAVKGVVGLGLPTVAMGLLGLVMRPAEAAALLVVPSLVTNLWQLADGPAIRLLLRRLWPMLGTTVVGILVGSRLLHGLGGPGATLGLGIVLVLYALVGLTGFVPAVSRPAERWAGPLIGLATGFVSAATGVFVVPGVPYLNALGLSRDDLIQALGLYFTVSTVALGAALIGAGTLDASSGLASALATVPALAGMALGGVLRSRVSPPVFRTGFFVGLLVLGAYMAGSTVTS